MYKFVFKHMHIYNLYIVKFCGYLKLPKKCVKREDISRLL